LAGRKQHYIPRSFLRGFLSHKRKDSEYVWVFPKGRSPYNPEISGAASERHFYSELPNDGEQTLDTRITDYEGRFVTLLNQLRQSSPGVLVDSAIAAEVIVHLTIRNAGLRDAMADGLKGVLAKTFSMITREGALRDLAGLDKSEPDARFQEIMGKIITGDGNFKKLGLPDQLLTRVGFFLAKETVPQNLEVDPAIKTRLALMYHHAEPFTRELHNKTLAKELIPQQRLLALTPLRWKIVNQPNLILPDCVALGFKDNVSPEPLATMGETFVTVTMPITKDLLLIGQREEAPPFFPSLFNLCATACSHEYFIAANKTPENEQLAGRIGIWSRKFLYESLAALEEEYPSASVKLPEPEKEEFAEPATSKSPLNYQLTFSGWADQEIPPLVAEKIKPLVTYMAERYSLALLDGMTFAMDYENVLATMDRGYEAPPMRTASLEYGVGWSLPVDVLRDGIHKVRIVFRGGIGQLLLIDDEAGRKMAEQMVVFQLANIAFKGMVNTAFADKPLPQSGPWIDTVRKELMGYAVGSYFAARESSIFSPGNEQAGRELLTGAVEDARKIIMEERLSYRFHGDLQKFLTIVRQQVAPILKFAAELAGHMDGVGAPDGADVDLKDLLGRVNLGTWFDQFRLDLRAQLADKRRWETVEAFQEINYHAERVLWAFGVFPWTTPDGQNRVHIPLILDAARLRQASLRRPLGFARVLLRGLGKWLTRFFKRK